MLISSALKPEYTSGRKSSISILAFAIGEVLDQSLIRIRFGRSIGERIRKEIASLTSQPHKAPVSRLMSKKKFPKVDRFDAEDHVGGPQDSAR